MTDFVDPDSQPSGFVDPDAAPAAKARTPNPWINSSDAMDVLRRGADTVGGTVTDVAAKVLPPKIAAGLGWAANVATQVAPMVIGGEVAKRAAPLLRSGAESLMQSALKPNVAMIRQGKAAQAINTMLDEGISVTPGGLTKLRNLISELNGEISLAIRNSPASVDKTEVIKELLPTLARFKNQVNPGADVSAIENAGREFLNHPLLQSGTTTRASLEQALQQASAAKISALQDAGRFKTFASQQENFAHGGGINLRGDLPGVPGQTPNTPYINVGALGGRDISPSAYPVENFPRIAGRYTENIQRVPEGASAFNDAMSIYGQRKAEEQAASTALESFLAKGGENAVPVQTAQALKQGTYQAIGDRAYGELSGAATEAQKALARGLKQEIAKAVPEIAGLNARESSLLNALTPVERRVLIEGNKNPNGLALIARSPSMWAAFMLDRSAAFKSIMARALNAGQEQIPATAARLGIGATEVLTNKQQ